MRSRILGCFNYFTLITLFAFSPISNSANNHYENAITSFHEGLYDETIIHLKNALQEKPADIPSRLLLAETFLAQGKGEVAETELLDLQDDGVDFNQLVAHFAQAYFLQDKYHILLEKITPGYRGKSTEAEVLYYRGQAYLALNQLHSADNEFMGALEVDPDHQPTKIARAQLAIQQGQLSRASRYIDEALDDYEPSANAWIVKSLVLQMQGEANAALRALDEAIRITPNHLQARLSRALLYLNIEKTEFALKDLEFVLAEIPNEPRAKYLYAYANATLGDIEKSRLKLNEVITTLSAIPDETMANNPSYFYLAGLINFEYGNYVEARHYLESFLRLRESNINALRLLAIIEINQEEFVSAKNLLTKTNVHFPGDPSILTLLGITYMELGETLRAKDFFEQVLDLQPNREYALENLAKSKMATGNYEDAINNLLTAQKLSGGHEAEQDISLTMLLLESYIKSKEYDKAFDITSKLIVAHPKNSLVFLRHGIVLGLKGEKQKARQAFETSYKIDSNLDAVIHLARMDVVEGNSEKGLESLLTQLKASPQNVRIMIEIGDIYQRSNNTGEAATWYKKAYATNQNDTDVLTKLVTSHILLNELELAQETLIFYLEKHPKNYRIRSMLGRLYIELNQPHKAIIEFKTAASDSQNKAQAYMELASAHLLIQDRAAAIKSLDKAIAWDSSKPTPLLTLFPLLLQQENYVRAQATIDNLSELNIDGAKINLLSADLAKAQGNHERAEFYFKKVTAKHQHQKATLGLFHALLEQKKYKEAESTLTRWLKKQPNDLIAHIALTESYIAQNEKEKALSYYQNLMKQFNELPIFLNNAAGLAYELNKTELALNYANKAYQLRPQNVSVIDTLGWILSREGERKEAIDLFRKALSIEYNNAEIKYHLARTLYEEDRVNEAKKLMLEAIKSEQDFVDKEEAKLLFKQWHY